MGFSDGKCIYSEEERSRDLLSNMEALFDPMLERLLGSGKVQPCEKILVGAQHRNGVSPKGQILEVKSFCLKKHAL